jgi:hypothetical protein
MGKLPPDENGPTGSGWVPLAGVFVALGGLTILVCGILQAGTLVAYTIELIESSRIARQSPSASRNASTPPSATPLETLAAIETVLTTRAVSKVASPETSAEGSERAVPIGLDAAFSEDAGDTLFIGERPPPQYPWAPCDDVFVYIVTLAEGAPTRSAASLGIGKAGPARSRRPGQRIGAWTVLAIADDSTGLNPEVWLQKDGTACKAELAGNPARAHVPLRPAPRSRPAPRHGKRRRR